MKYIYVVNDKYASPAIVKACRESITRPVINPPSDKNKPRMEYQDTFSFSSIFEKPLRESLIYFIATIVELFILIIWFHT